MKIYKDFDTFSRALMTSQDVDPVYPFIKSLLKKKDYEPEWFIFIYVMFYSLDSAIKFCDVMPCDYYFDVEKFKELRKTVKHFGHERRGHCRNVNNQILMINEYLEYFVKKESIKFYRETHKDNASFQDYVASMKFNGGWASFKTTELFEKALDYTQLAISDLGLDGRNPNSNDGPVGGLRWLFGRDIEYNKNYFDIWNDFGRNLSKAWGVDMGKVETCLCKWHKFYSGKYFIGHDIQEFVELEDTLGKKDYTDIMEENFDPVFWYNKHKLEKNLKKHYAETGEFIYADKFLDSIPSINVKEIMYETYSQHV